MNVGQYILVLGIRVYRGLISPVKTFVFGPMSQCRFTPSCSAYALESVRRHGALRGSWLALKRICRCHPWGGCGHDPVPPLANTAGKSTPEIPKEESRQAGEFCCSEPLSAQPCRSTH